MDFLGRALYWWTLGWSFVSLWLERLWARFWGLCTVVMFFMALSLSGLLFKFGKTAHFSLLVLFAVLAFAAAFYTGRRFIMPRRWQVERRIEHESGLKHRPLQMLHDKPEEGTSPAAAKLWYKQQAQSRASWTRLRVWRPRPRVGRQDKYNLRFAAMLCLVLALVMSRGHIADRLGAALTPPSIFKTTVTLAAVDVWIEPPAYTSAAPVFLATAQTGRNTAAAASVPAGSLLKIRVGGVSRPPRLFFDDQQALVFTTVGPGNYTAEITLEKTTRMEIRRSWWQSGLGAWDITVIPDSAPDIKILDAGAAERAALKISYSARDDYAIRSLRAVIEPSPDIPAQRWHETIEFDIPFSGQKSREGEQHIENLAQSPMAGQPVMLRLIATDDVGNVAESNIEKIVLPEREFKNPVAAALNRERKRLIRYDDPLTMTITRHVLTNIANRPALIKEDLRVFLGLVVAIKRLSYAPTPHTAQTVRDMLWYMALRIEDGGLALAREELRQALQKLNQALNDKNISEERLQELTEEVNKKTQQYMQELAKEMRQRMEQGDEQQNQPQISPELAQKLMEKMDMSEMEKMMQQMQHGDTREQMQAMTEMMQKMLDATDPKNAMSEKDQKALEQMQKMEDLIQKQEKLMDETGKMQPKQESGEQSGTQGEIRKELGGVMRDMGENMPEVPEHFGNADQEMKQSQQQLDRDAPGRSIPHQKEALEQLKQGQDQAMQQMADRMKQQMMMSGGGQGSGSGGNYGQGFDPLGRNNNGRGNPDNAVKIPDEKERRRVQQIIQELRKRSNDWERPRQEREYLDRLLDPYSN